MKKKTYEFGNGKKDESYIKEIKEIIMKNPETKTKSGFDEKGNYVMSLFIPDWRDKFKKDSLKAIERECLDRKNKQYGDWQNNSKSYTSTSSYRDNDWNR